jgi:O-antigen/teichoic acid export membrane protein
MRELVKGIYANPMNARIIEWGKLISITGSAQVAVQMISFICGLMIIRLLPTKDYAVYTLATTMLGTMTMIADGGITTGVISQAGKVWQNRYKLGSVLNTGIYLRNKMAIVCMLLCIPIFFYMLEHHKVGWQVSIPIVISLILVYYANLSGIIIDFPLKLWQDVKSLQKIQVITNLGRLLVCLALFLFPFTFIAIIASCFPQLWSNRKTKNASKKYADFSQPQDVVVKKEIVKIVRKMLPNALYYSISGQLTIWIISLNGSITALAQIGALGRLMMILMMINIIFNTVFTPRIARMPNNPKLLLIRFFQIQAGLLVVCSFILFFVWQFPSEVLWILGNKYAGLKDELILSVLASCLGLFSAVAVSFCSSKGWAINPFVFIPISVLSIIIGVATFKISTIQGVLLYNVFTTVIQVFLFLGFTAYKILRDIRTMTKVAL